MPLKKHAFVVSHTHWDREWYRTFQDFRNRLVFLMDELVSELESNEKYKYFHLDGQTIVLEDYLAIRPEMRSRLEKLVRDGRIIIGPWYVMPDEFLVSGESLVRNLQYGARDAARFGTTPMPVGYVVDIFGHNSQFPQILNGFGIESAVLYRGIGDYPKDYFLWTGIDGSSVLTAKLDNERSYSNFYFALRWPFEGRTREQKELCRRAKELLDFAAERSVSHNLLMMDGVDHQEMEPELPEILDEINNGVSDVCFEHVRLVDYFEAQKQACPEPEEISGELYRVGRRGINNQLLKNVLSSIVTLKQDNDFCETQLTRWVEPFSSLLGISGKPTKHRELSGFLREAWRLLLENHPHDSICGCSITRVHQDNIHRFHQVKDICESVLTTVFNDLLDDYAIPESVDPAARGRRLVIVNAGQQPVSGIIKATLLLPAECQGNLRLTDADGNAVPFQLLGVRTGQVQGKFRYKRLPDFRRCQEYDIAFQAEVPPVGLATYRYYDYRSVAPGPGDFHLRAFTPPERFEGSMRIAADSWESDHYLIVLTSKGIRLTQKAAGRTFDPIFQFEDGGDYGDGWVYRKPVADRIVSSVGREAEYEILSNGPFLLIVAVRYIMAIPVSSSITGRSSEMKKMGIRTIVTFQKDSALISCVTEIENHCVNHRMRVIFPLAMRAQHYATATPFALEKRSFEREDNHDAVEWDCGVVPSQGITIMRDESAAVGLYTRGLYEIEAPDTSARYLALTLFRSFENETGRARGDMSRMQGLMKFEYAIDIQSPAVSTEALYIRGSDWRAGIRSYCPDGEGSVKRDSDASLGLLTLKGEGIVLSSCRSGDNDDILVRVFNIRSDETEGSLSLSVPVKTCQRLCLDEIRPSEKTEDKRINDHTFGFTLGKAEVTTFRITREN